jgi:anti-anti-sigma factor
VNRGGMMTREQSNQIEPGCGRVMVIRTENTLRTPVDRALRDTVAALLRRGDRRLILDLETLEGLDAAGIGELISLCTATTAAGGVFRIARPCRRVRQLLEITGVFGVLSADSACEKAAPGAAQPRRRGSCEPAICEVTSCA